MNNLKNNKQKMMGLALICLFLFSFSFVNFSNNSSGIESNFNFILKTFRGHGYIRSDLFSLLTNQINLIDLNPKSVIIDAQSGWPFIKNYDVGLNYIETQGEYNNPISMYTENGIVNKNFWEYNQSIDWDNELEMGKNEWYLQQWIDMALPQSEERIELFYEWQNHLMLNILPCIPLLNIPDSFTFHWPELIGYINDKGLLQSFSDMYWETPHLNQKNTSEIIRKINIGTEYNPLNSKVLPYEDYFKAIYDPLFWKDNDQSVWPHLASSLDMLNNTHLRISLREGVKWQQDIDGNFTDEYFDAEDAYFSLYCWKELSKIKSRFDWIKSMKIIDRFTLDIFTRGDELLFVDPYGKFLTDLSVSMLPEHYLNQSQLEDGVTPDKTHLAWDKIEQQFVGTGMFTMKKIRDGKEIILSLDANSWTKNATQTSGLALEWTRRFGANTGNLSQIRYQEVPYDMPPYDWHGDFADERQEIAQFLSGNLDFAVLNYIELKYCRDFIFDSGFIISPSQTGICHYLIFNLNDKKFSSTDPAPNDPAISTGLALRRAITHAINIDELQEIVFPNYPKLSFPIPRNYSIWCNPEIQIFEYNLDLAHEYLYKAGLEEITKTASFAPLFIVSTVIMIFIITKWFLKKRRRINNEMK